MLLHADRYWWLMPTSLLTAFLWQAWPLPHTMRQLCPDAILLTTLYWSLRRPHQIGSGIALLIGLFRDSLEGTLLGQHALALVVTTYLMQLFYLQVRMFAIWQQCLVIGLLAAVYLTIGHWVYLLTHTAPANFHYLLPALPTALGWLVCYALLRYMERGSWRKTA